MRAPHLVAVLLLTGLVSACGGENDKPRSDDESPSDSSSSSPSDQATTASEPTGDGTTLRQAIRRLLRDDTGYFSTTIDLGVAGSIEREGGFQRRPRASYSETVVDYTDSDPVTVVSVAIEGRQWVRPVIEAGGPACWVETDPATVSESLGLDVSGTSTGFPAELAAVLSARGGQAPEKPALADVYTISSLVTGKFTAALGLENPNAFSPIPVELELSNGEVRGFRTSLDDIVAAARRAGAEPNPVVDDLSAGGPGEIEVIIDGGAASPPIEPPPASETVELNQDADQFEAEMKACSASLG